MRILAPYSREYKPREDTMHEECGVFGIYRGDNSVEVAEAAYYGLFALQHRGQESAGISVSDGKTIRHKKGMGLLTEVFGDEDIKTFQGAISAIGHVRYSTSGQSTYVNAQPLVIDFKKGCLSLAHNGNLVNSEVLREKLEDGGAIFQTSIDSEIIAYLIAKNSEEGIVKAIEKTIAAISGSYALVIQTEDKLIGVRDPMGIRPLSLGKVDGNYMIASESCAFDALDGEFIRDIHPGEIIIIDSNGIKSHRATALLDSALCIFEFVYFARPDSDIDGINVHQARENAGMRLALSSGVEADLVAGVPDSARPAATGYAEQSGIPYKKVLARNRYVGRTFIQPQQLLRERSVKVKLNVLKRNVYNKRLILVDDSIVRGTTSKKIVEMIKLAGAREVHMRISSPPVVAPCYFGIDTPSHEQLIGAKNSVEEIRKIIGADSLSYLSIEDLLKTVEGASCNFCVGCFNGKYPVEVCEKKKIIEAVTKEKK